jgi:Cys-rich repeat protein
MASFLRTGFLAVTFGIALGIANGCSSSSDSGLTARSGDGGPDASSFGGVTGGGGSGATGNGGSGATGSGATGSGATTGAGGTSGGGTSGGSGGAIDGGGTSCTADSACTGAAKRCDPALKVCVQCLFDNECAGAERCTAGRCATIPACTNSLDCSAHTDGRTICDPARKICVACAADPDCGPNRVCAVDTCVDSATCTPLPDGGTSAGGACKAGLLCTSAGKCVECVADSDCASGSTCLTGQCRLKCVSDNDCTPHKQLCDFKNGACVDCTADAACAALEYCAAGSCKPDVCAQGVKSCVSGAVIECTANGGGILAPVACTAGKECVKSGTSASCEIPRLPDGGLPLPASCSDGKKNGDETDKDCGGATCKKCGDGALCAVAGDCTSTVCTASCSGVLCFPGTRDKQCRPASCSDRTKNGAETAVDCGGGTCQRCTVGSVCTKNADCETDVCTGGKCAAAACTANQCAACFLTQQACCKPSGLCGCATTFPFPGTCQ